MVVSSVWGNQNVVSALQAENSMLKAENYSDKNAKEVYAQSLADNRRLRDETFAYLKPLADESATKTRTFKVYINVTAEISNTNFGLGQLFPRNK